MVSMQAVRAHNQTLKSLGPDLVGIFVGGTSGIALSTALAFARYTSSPKIYLIGRNRSAADAAITDIHDINASAQPSFLQTDISLLKNVDKVCDDILAKEKKVNLLFMTPGYLTLKGRNETSEGLDRKMVLHYYARMRFIEKLAPLLQAAAEDTSVSSRLSRVISVLDPHASVRGGGSGTFEFADLDLRQKFSLAKCAAHASLMNNFYLEGLAQRYPHTSFIHSYPSGVATGVMRELPGGKVTSAIVGTLFKPFLVPVQESGERHLFAATHEGFAPRIASAEMNEDGAVGSEGLKGSGCYWVSWDGKVFPPNKKIEQTRGEGAVEKVQLHTEEVFKRVCDEGQTYS